MSRGTAVFLDTSIQIARAVHSPESKARIADRVSSYDLVVTSEVVKQEYKRRLLKEAQYLLNQLNRLGSFQRVRRHVSEVLPPQQLRKQKICLQTLDTIFEKTNGAGGDEELTERCRRYLRCLLRFGLDDFENSVQHIEGASGCACAKQPVLERRPYRDYDLGKDRCSMVADQCGIARFLREREGLLSRLQDRLEALRADHKTEELKRAQEFLGRVSDSTEVAHSEDPCLTVGDLLIALESAEYPDFYTKNARESRFFCKLLNQTMIVRPNNHAYADVVCPRGEADWESILRRPPVAKIEE